MCSDFFSFRKFGCSEKKQYLCSRFPAHGLEEGKKLSIQT